MMKTIACIQGSPEWLQIRAGKVTASEVWKSVAFNKNGKESAERANYRGEIIAEILTGLAQDHFVSRDMEWGTEYEAAARTEYELRTGSMVDTVGFIQHPTIERSGGSPDGLVDQDGGLEIKCPRSTTHIKWMLAGVVPEEHRPQMYWYMACSQRDWWDFASYDPRMPEHLQLFTARLKWDDAEIQNLESGVLKFLAEVDATIAELHKLSPEPVSKPAQKSVIVNQLEQSLGITDAEIEAIRLSQLRQPDSA